MAKNKGIKLTIPGEVRGTQVAQPMTKEAVARQRRSDLEAPTLSFAISFSSTVILAIGEELDPDFVPAVTDFDIQVAGAPDVVTAIAVSGDAVRLTLTTAITAGQAVTVTYTKPTANTWLRDMNGNALASFTAQTAYNLTETEDTTVPRLALTCGDGGTLRLLYDEQLDTGSVPAVGAFAVVVAGGADVVTAVAINGSVVALTLTTAAVEGDVVTISYTAGASPVQDLAGNDAANLVAQSVENFTDPADTTAPVLSFITGTGTTIRLHYDEPLTVNTPTVTAFVVLVNGGAVTESSPVVSGNVVSFTIDVALVPSDTFTVAYTAGATPIEDTAGNNAANFGATAGINVTGDTVAPTVGHRRINRTILTIFYNEALDTASVPATGDFAVLYGAGAATVSSVAVAGSVVTLTMATAPTIGQAVTVAYTAGANPIRDLASNNAANYAAQTVVNSTDTQAPRLAKIYGSGTQIVLDFDEQLTENSPTLSAFAVVVNGSGATESAAVVSGSVVTITIATALVPGDTFTVAYTAGATPIEDLVGNNAANFGATAGENLSKDTQAPRLSYVTGNGTSIKLHYDEPLTENSPTVSAFAVVVNGSGATESAVSVAGHIVDITIAATLNPQDTFTVAYTAGATPIRDRAGNNAVNFGATAGINITSDTIAPRFAYAVVNKTALILDYDEQLDTASVPATTDYSYSVNGGGGQTPSAVAIAGSSVTLTITAVQNTDTVTVTYTAGANPVQDLAGNNAVNLVGQATQNIGGDNQAPRLGYISGNGTSIYLHYDEPLTENTPTITAFVVLVNGGAVTESSPVVEGHVVRFTISTALISSDTFTLAYTAGVTPIQDLAGNNAANFGATAGQNLTDRAVGGTPSTQDYSDAAAGGSSATATALDHKHGFPAPSGTYDAIIAAGHIDSYWDDFGGRLETISSSERYSALSSGGTTPAFDDDATTGKTLLRSGIGVSLATEYTFFAFEVATFLPRAAEDWGYKVLVNEPTAPVIGAGSIFYLLGFIEGIGVPSSTADGIYFRSQNSGNWFLVCRDAGVETTVDLGVGPDTTVRLLELRITSNGTSVQAYVDSVLTGAAITTNIPTNRLGLGLNVICDADITTAGEVNLRGHGYQDGF